MNQKLMVIFFMIFLVNTANVHSQMDKKMELYDIQKGRVIKTVPINSNLQELVKGYITGIENIYVKINPIPREGFMIKIPLEPSIHIQNQWMNTLVDEIIIIFTKNEKPYLMIFDDENNPHFFQFKGSNTNEFLKTFNIKIKD